MIWFLRAGALGLGGWLGYLQLFHDIRGVLIGAAIAIAVIGVEAMLTQLHLVTLVFGAVGAVLGLLVSRALDATILQMGSVETIHQWNDYALLVRFALAYLGLVIALKKVPELETLDKDILAIGKKRGRDIRVLDTSAIIDGRVADICETKFLSGTFVVPRFIMQELHSLSDSAESLVRARGRRGLDILARLQENPHITVQIYDRDVPGVPDVDSKVVRLAKDLNGQVITTDFNLHKVAALEGVTVLNVNDLSAALKPIVLPGEGMSVFVMKEGKERDQGVGYLDDGTMVVVEDGRRHIGKRIEVSVASILQTSAGRMIFAKSREKGERGEKEREKEKEKEKDKPA
jgi:uncharacterized protein YacL